jgi:uncharacterized membrane protein YhaH (DUF805 family)
MKLFDAFLLFKGRITRLEFALGFLVQLAVAFVVTLGVFAVLGVDSVPNAPENFPLWLLVIIIPLLVHQFSLGIRRLHDIGISGLFSILFFVPIVNYIALIFLLIMPSQKRDNAYGPVIIRKRPFLSWIVGDRTIE